MALSGGRRIMVRGVSFRWKFTGWVDRWGNTPQHPDVVVQEESPRPGRPMVAHLESKRWTSHDSDMWEPPHRATVSPADVRKLIEHCLDLGWNPSERVQFYCPAEVDLSDYQTYSTM